MYEQFALTVLPQAVTINTQQTPNLKNIFNKINMDIVFINHFMAFIIVAFLCKINIYPPAQELDSDPPFWVHSGAVIQVPFL